MPDKVFKTYRQLVSILRARGVNIKQGSAGSRTMRILEKENYYNVVNGYKDLFIDQPHTATHEEAYKTSTEFDEIYSLYSFDREIRIIYLKYILKLENHFKTVVSHYFSKQYGFKNYLKLENFQNTASTNIGELSAIARRYRLDLTYDINKINRISLSNYLFLITP